MGSKNAIFKRRLDIGFGRINSLSEEESDEQSATGRSHGQRYQRHRQSPTTRRWLMGDFGNPDTAIPSKAGKIKWGRHRAGDERTEDKATADSKFRSLGILLQGEVHYWFKDAAGETHEVVLSNFGDYVVWDKGVLHWWRIESDDTLVVTFRWVEAEPEAPPA